MDTLKQMLWIAEQFCVVRVMHLERLLRILHRHFRAVYCLDLTALLFTCFCLFVAHDLGYEVIIRECVGALRYLCYTNEMRCATFNIYVVLTLCDCWWYSRLATHTYLLMEGHSWGVHWTEPFSLPPHRRLALHANFMKLNRGRGTR